MFKKYLVALLLGLLTSISGHATHLIGGEVYYNYLGANNYEIIVLIYRDCLPGVTGQLDQSIPITVFDQNGTIVSNVVVGIESVQNVDIVASIECLVDLPNLCVQKGTYRTVVNLQPVAGGYTIAHQRCCRGSAISNIVNPGDQGMTFFTQVPGPETAPSNNAARFESEPPTVICNNLPFSFDHSATDADGDQLVYELCTPYHGGGSGPGQPQPNPAAAPPYQQVPWGNGYSANNPIDANPIFSIDATTGLLTGTPTQLGNYVVGVCVKEFRNGVLVGETRRDYRFTTSNCEVDAAASIPEQTDFCSGFTLDFSSGTSLGTSFWWDFGDTTTLADTSELPDPSWTYSDPGFVTITLIAYGDVCSDTATITYQVIPDDSAHFLPQEGQCFEGNEFIFEQDGYSSVNSTFLWEFGPVADPDTSTQGNPPPITFKEPGIWPVTLRIFRDVCEVSYTDTVPVWAHPVAEFEITDSASCEPLLVEFLDRSTSETPLLYFYSFDDGDTAFLAEPSHIYPEAGKFQPQLTVISTGRCIDTSTYVFPDSIRVYPVPTADFVTTEARVSILNPRVRVFDRSSLHDFCRYQVEGDTTIYEECDLNLLLPSEGRYQIYQEVSTEFGCADTTFRTVHVLPNRSIWIPNAFSPNNDLINDIFQPKFEGITGFQMRIYDRFGTQVFSTFDPEEGWDGTVNRNGPVAQQGVYAYSIRFINLETNQEEKYHGHVSLVHHRN